MSEAIAERHLCKVMEILKANGKNVFEDAGVMPNPTVQKLQEGMKTMGDVKITSTPYDDVFRTLLNDRSSLIIPMINIFSHEKRFREYEQDEGKHRGLQEEYGQIRDRLEEALNQGGIRGTVSILKKLSIP